MTAARIAVAVDGLLREHAANGVRQLDLPADAGSLVREIAEDRGIEQVTPGHGERGRRRLGLRLLDDVSEAERPVRLGGGDVENGEARLVVPEHDGLDGAIDRLHLHAARHRSRYFASGFGASAAMWTFLMTMGSSGTF